MSNMQLEDERERTVRDRLRELSEVLDDCAEITIEIVGTSTIDGTKSLGENPAEKSRLGETSQLLYRLEVTASEVRRQLATIRSSI